MNQADTAASPASAAPGASRVLAEFAAQLRFTDIPADVIHRMKTSMLDSIGCCLHGMTLPWTQRVRDLVLDEGAAPAASIWGTGKKGSVAGAVLVNATAGHAFELDDIHKESVVHPGSIAVPVVIALAEQLRAHEGKQLLTAMVAGYEVGTRVGNAATTALFFQGFHPQGTSGVFVAAAAAGKMMGLDAQRMLHALGIAGSQAGGLMAAQEGAMVKRFHSGRAAQSGVYSAQLAAKGFTGIEDVLEAEYGGYLSSYSTAPKVAKLTEGLGAVWESGKVGYKPYACVTSIHAALQGIDHLMKTQGLRAADIASVRIGVSKMTHTHCAWEYKAQGVTAAQMNLYYGVAVMALERSAFVEQYAYEKLDAPQVFDFISRIEAYVDPELERMGPAFRHAARIAIRTGDGRQFQHEALNRRGSPEDPMSADDVEYKFRQIVASVLSPEDAGKVVSLVARIDEEEHCSDLVDIIQASRAPGATL